jgi:hypothetical protein
MTKRFAAVSMALEKLERIVSPPRQSYVVFGSCPLPDDEPITDSTIERWLSEGLASPYSGSLPHVIRYHGGKPNGYTMNEWLAAYGPGAMER